jgi:hypothetical protein
VVVLYNTKIEIKILRIKKSKLPILYSISPSFRNKLIQISFEIDGGGYLKLTKINQIHCLQKIREEQMYLCTVQHYEINLN